MNYFQALLVTIASAKRCSGPFCLNHDDCEPGQVMHFSLQAFKLQFLQVRFSTTSVNGV